MIAPDIFKFDSCESFFNEFFHINKGTNGTFSHRFFAKKIGWSSTYLSGIMQGRKKLGVLQAIQFSRLFEMSDFETERLVLLSLKASESSDIKNFSTRMTAHLDRENPSEIIEDPDISSFEAGAVMNLLIARNRILEPHEIMDRLYTVPDLTKDKIEKIVTLLIEKRILLVENDGSIKESGRNIYFNRSASEFPPNKSQALFEKYIGSMRKHCETRKRPWSYRCGAVVFSKRYMKVVAEMSERFILNTMSLKEDDKPQNNGAFQIIIGLFPLDKTEKPYTHSLQKNPATKAQALTTSKG
ncbi:MAG: hypothetical protein AB7T49_11445 [Oligoflexales bacterium]